LKYEENSNFYIRTFTKFGYRHFIEFIEENYEDIDDSFLREDELVFVLDVIRRKGKTVVSTFLQEETQQVFYPKILENTINFVDMHLRTQTTLNNLLFIMKNIVEKLSLKKNRGK